MMGWLYTCWCVVCVGEGGVQCTLVGCGCRFLVGVGAPQSGWDRIRAGCGCWYVVRISVCAV